MKFVKLTAVEHKRLGDDRTKWGFVAVGPVLINLERVAYVGRTFTYQSETTCITFMDHNENSCCVYVMESFEDLPRLVEARS